MGIRPGGGFLEVAAAAARQARIGDRRGSRRQDLRDRRRDDDGRYKDPFFSFFGPSRVLGTNEVYDPATNKWESRRPMSVPRNHAFSGVVNGKIYVIGGRTGHGFILSATNTDVVEEYNPSTTRGACRRNGCRPRAAAVRRARTGAGITSRAAR